jgi:hypothetical protein
VGISGKALTNNYFRDVCETISFCYLERRELLLLVGGFAMSQGKRGPSSNSQKPSDKRTSPLRLTKSDVSRGVVAVASVFGRSGVGGLAIFAFWQIAAVAIPSNLSGRQAFILRISANVLVFLTTALVSLCSIFQKTRDKRLQLLFGILISLLTLAAIWVALSSANTVALAVCSATTITVIISARRRRRDALMLPMAA